MSNTHRFFIEDGQGGILTEDGEEAMDYIIEEEEFNLRNLTNLAEYKECQPVPIELNTEDENLENRISLVIEKVNKTIANKAGNVRNYASTGHIFAEKFKDVPFWNSHEMIFMPNLFLLFLTNISFVRRTKAEYDTEVTFEKFNNRED